jgi:uncharacterized secreted protein with C-terminal beta-propeller domain
MREAVLGVVIVLAVIAVALTSYIIGQISAAPSATETVQETIHEVKTVTVHVGADNYSVSLENLSNIEFRWVGYGYLVEPPEAVSLILGYEYAGPKRYITIPTVTPTVPLVATMAAEVSSVPQAPSGKGLPYSTTNVQVLGIDEPDIVENNGTHLFVASGSSLRVYKAWPPEELQLVGQVDVKRIVEEWVGKEEVVVRGKTGEQVIAEVEHNVYVKGVLSRSDGGVVALASDYVRPSVLPPRTIVIGLDKDLNVEGMLVLSGAFYDARLFNETMVVVTEQYSGPPIVVLYKEPQEPVVSITDEAVLVSVEQAATTVYAIDVSSWTESSLTLVGVRPRALYVSATGNIYVAVPSTEKLRESIGENITINTLRRELPAILPRVEGWNTTILKLRIKDGRIVVDAKATLPGTVRKQWQLDEYEGVLRVVVTSFTKEGLSVDVYTLNTTDLSMIGELRGVALRENIHAVRFLGPILYLVTFRQIDPLFTIDLSDPANPKVLGFLEAPGFDEYIHPITNDALLGVGTEEGSVRITLYHLEDGVKPVPVSRLYVSKVLGTTHSWTPVLNPETGHRAFVYYPEKSLVLLPVNGYAAGVRSSGVLVVHVDTEAGKLEAKGFVEHLNAQRTAYIGDYGYSIAPSMMPEVKAFSLETLETIAVTPKLEETTVKAIVENPEEYTGRLVRVTGVFMGWKAGEDLGAPPVTKSDWVLESKGYQVYVAATGAPMPGDPVRDAGRLVVEVTGYVRLTSDDRPYIEPISVKVIGKYG